jgi:hypothetical protein
MHIPAETSHPLRLKTATSSNPNSAIDSNRMAAATYSDMIVFQYSMRFLVTRTVAIDPFLPFAFLQTGQSAH